MKEIYRSKKPDKTDLTAELVKRPNESTVILKYLTGDEKGKSVTISTSTLKRYWRKEQSDEVTETPKEKTPEEILNIDMEEVNKPYKPDVTPHYIEKPESVKEYEESKRRKPKCEFKLPETYSEYADILADNDVKLKSVNKGYIALEDASKLKLLSTGIGVLASTALGEALAKSGLTSRPCIEQGTPFRFDIKTSEQNDALIKALAFLYPLSL